MNAQDFYQVDTPIALIKLLMLTKKDFSMRHDQLPQSVQIAFRLKQFKANLGDVVIIGDEHGQVTDVYIGQGEGSDRDAILHAVLHLPQGTYQACQPLSIRASVAWSLAQYRFTRYKKRDLTQRVLVVASERLPDILAETTSVFLTRDLINTPAQDMGPQALTEALKTVAEQHGALFEQWIGDELVKHGFPAIYAVGRAAHEAPRLSMLTWGQADHPRVTLVGKGVCFDSGGLDIKPSSGMRLMKKDMGGAAQVIGLAHWLMSHHLPIRLQVLVPAVENAIGSRAYRPGDVLTMRNGLTVEIDNTDAEGRLILADALVKAYEFKPDLVIDFATLTGAARVAVGTEISAFFSNDDALSQGIQQAASDMHDTVWRMPLFPGYASLNDSTIADLSNSSSSSYAGAITAALFLERFVDNTIPWAHFDIMAWNVTNKPGKPEGGEAMGMQAVAAYLIRRFHPQNSS